MLIKHVEDYADGLDSGVTGSSFVDMYNATSNSWTSNPTGLGQARSELSGVSLPSGLVVFAGGFAGGNIALVFCKTYTRNFDLKLNQVTKSL